MEVVVQELRAPITAYGLCLLSSQDCFDPRQSQLLLGLTYIVLPAPGMLLEFPNIQLELVRNRVLPAWQVKDVD